MFWGPVSIVASHVPPDAGRAAMQADFSFHFSSCDYYCPPVDQIQLPSFRCGPRALILRFGIEKQPRKPGTLSSRADSQNANVSVQYMMQCAVHDAMMAAASASFGDWRRSGLKALR